MPGFVPVNSPHHPARFFAPRPLLAGALILLFGLGLAIRLYDITNLPLDFHPTRQLLSALKARGMYDQDSPGIPEWQRQMALQQWRARAEIEPEVMERLVAFTYSWTGERLWVARIYSSLFWVIGGAFLFLLLQDMFSADAAVIALAYYLFFPYAVIASRAFQPDPLMVMWILAFWWAFHRWVQRPSWAFSILAGLLGGMAIFVKFVAVFFVIGAALGEALGRLPWRDLVRRAQLWVMILLGALPAAVYLFYGLVLHGFLGRQFTGRFLPQLLLSPQMYTGWFAEANLAAGAIPIMLGLLGLLAARDKSLRSHLIGLWAAYLLFGLFFDYAIATHDYYQEPLIPLVAVSLAAILDPMMAALANLTRTRWLRAAASLLLCYGLFATAWDTRAQLKSVDYRPQAAMWAEIGSILNHGPRVIALTQDYGVRLAYWGWQNATIWPNSGDLDYHAARGATFNFHQTFAALTQSKRYFVVTDFAELARQPLLQQQLDRFAVLSKGDGYVILDLSRPSTSQPEMDPESQFPPNQAPPRWTGLEHVGAILLHTARNQSTMP